MKKTTENLIETLSKTAPRAGEFSYIIASAEKEIRRLAQIVDRLPATADDVPITQGMRVYLLPPFADPKHRDSHAGWCVCAIRAHGERRIEVGTSYGSQRVYPTDCYADREKATEAA